ncbi:MAG: hypothetical protein AB8F78_02655 [Saprospiraceae bacterium]
MKNRSPDPNGSSRADHRALYCLVAKHWHEELVNADVSDEWLTQHAGDAPAIVRKLILELKQKSEVCHELLRNRLTDLNLGLKEDEAFSKLRPGVQLYGLMGKLEELYTSNAMLTGRSEELIASMRGVQDGRTASLLARMRNIQLDRHKLYARFFQPGHSNVEVTKRDFGYTPGDN